MFQHSEAIHHVLSFSVLSPYAISFMFLYGVLVVGVEEYILIISGYDSMYIGEGYSRVLRLIHVNIVGTIQHLLVLLVILYESFETGILDPETIPSYIFPAMSYVLFSWANGRMISQTPKPDHFRTCLVLLN